MKAPLEWLKEYVEINVGTDELCQRMIMHGLGVESVGKTYEECDGILVGRIKAVNKHPDADRLLVCNVDIGREEIVIVTAATNVYTGMICPVATDGSILPSGKKIAAGELRGILSQGMFCSGKELDIDEEDIKGASVDGILDLGNGYKDKIGMPFYDASGLNSTVIDFEISANRSDCMSITGIAKEISAALNTALKMPDIRLTESDEEAGKYIKVEVKDTDLCPRYTARVIKGIKIAPSPGWIKRRLQGAGIRPINNIVDITNYVMLEMGCPQHAFDYDCVNDGKIVVRRAVSGEKLTTLDGKEHTLDNEILVIADPEKAVGLAGVMGGANSEVTGSTSIVILETAKFDGPNNRHTSRKLGILTEAAARFTKGVDIQLPAVASDRAAQLFAELNCGTVLKGRVDTQIEAPKKRKVTARPERINHILGTDLSAEMMIECLKREHIEVEYDKKGALVCTIPYSRQDLAIEEDIAEEVARVYGYDKIPVRNARSVMIGYGLNPRQKKLDNVRRILNSYGLSECVTLSFIGERSFDMAGFDIENEKSNCVRIANPLSEDYALMRSSLMPSMLQVLALNIRNKAFTANLFEISNVHLNIRGDDGLPVQKCVLCIGSVGEAFYRVKGYIEGLLNEMGNIEAEFFNDAPEYYHPGRKATILSGGETIGEIGEIHPEILEKQGINKRAVIAEICLDYILDMDIPEKKYKPLPKYPALERDIAVTVSKDTQVGPMFKLIKQIGGDLLESAELFDIYQGEQTGADNKSVAFSLVFRADRTLTDIEANDLIDKIERGLYEKFGAKLRSN